jgi:chromosome segregation ATPase
MESIASTENAAETQVRVNIESLKALQPQMQDLKNVVTDYISTVQNAILKRRTDYQIKLSQLKTIEAQLSSKIEMNKKSRELLLEELSHEMRNRDQSSIKLEEMKIQQENLEKEKQNFIKQLDEIELQISNKIKQINEQRDVMKNQTTLVNDKLFQFEQLLGLRIKGLAFESIDDLDDEQNDENSETIKFIFNNVDPNNFARSVFFTFDPVSTSIISSEPELSKEIYDQAIKIFIESKEIVFLWKFMRSSLQAKLLTSQ